MWAWKSPARDELVLMEWPFGELLTGIGVSTYIKQDLKVYRSDGKYWSCFWCQRLLDRNGWVNQRKLLNVCNFLKCPYFVFFFHFCTSYGKLFFVGPEAVICTRKLTTSNYSCCFQVSSSILSTMTVRRTIRSSHWWSMMGLVLTTTRRMAVSRSSAVSFSRVLLSL